ncbi:hypothetical protein BA939_11300 [Rhizobium sp. S41]|nr:hypothetical protein BA939_11300 [Rhizobium sp. S41]KGE81458.1 hypothetical protein LW14_17590 [Rhizobium sp. H41]
MLTVAAVATVVSPIDLVTQKLPVLYADGINDDTDAVNALVNGKPFVVEGQVVEAKSGVLRGANIMISRPIEVSKPDGCIIADCIIRCMPNFKGEHMLRINIASRGSHIARNYFYGCGSKQEG